MNSFKLKSPVFVGLLAIVAVLSAAFSAFSVPTAPNGNGSRVESQAEQIVHCRIYWWLCR